MTKSRIVKCLLLPICFVMAAASLQLDTRSIDEFFLDWRQILFNTTPPNAPFLVLDITLLKDSEWRRAFDEKTYISILDKVATASSNKVILAVSPSEVKYKNAEEFKKKLLSYSKLYLLFDPERANPNSFALHPDFRSFPKTFGPQLTGGGFSGRTMRRIILNFETTTMRPNPDFQEFPAFFKMPFKEIKDFDKTFIYYDSFQVYMKIWPRANLPRFVPKDMDDLSKNIHLLEGKVVAIGTSDTYGVMNSKGIEFRKDLFSAPTIENSSWSDADLLVTYMINLFSGDYVKTPNFWMNVFWLTFWFFLVVYTICFVKQPYGFFLSFIEIFIFAAIGGIVFWISSYNLDFTRGIFGSIIFQYLIVPVVFFINMRKENVNKIQREKELERERFKTRFIVKAARADMNMQLAAKVSHDIRSPLMALQVASNVLKGKVATDVETLVSDSVARLKFIAEDVLKTYRSQENRDEGLEWIDLLEQIQELLKTYSAIHKAVRFTCHVVPGLSVCIPRYAFQRCLANLLNNSIEATGGEVHILISAIDDETSIRLIIADNGPGIAPELSGKLFQERSTFGKQQGTGLGLFQVRRDLSIYGALVNVKEVENGAAFEIIFPKSLSKIPFEVSKNILIIESEKNLVEAFNAIAGQADIFTCSTVSEALALLKSKDPKLRWTVFVDLVLASEDETGFDFIENVSASWHCKVVMCTSFADHAEVQQLASKYQSLLIKKSMLYQLDWKICAD